MTLDTFTHLIVRSLPSCRAAPSSTRKPAPGTVRLPESLIILEYLADVFPDAGLLPADPALRAKARLFAQTVETKFIPAFVGFLFMGAPVPAILGAVEALQSLLPEAQHASEKRPWALLRESGQRGVRRSPLGALRQNSEVARGQSRPLQYAELLERDEN